MLSLLSFSLSPCMTLRVRQTCWNTPRVRRWTPCVRSTVPLSPVAWVKMEQPPRSSSIILFTSHSRSRFSNSLRPSPTHRLHRYTHPQLSPNLRSHLTLICIPPFPSCIPSHQLPLWFKLLPNHRPILNPRPYPSINISPRASSRGQQGLSKPSPREKWSVRIRQDRADPQPVPTENPAQRETERMRQRWRSRREISRGPVVKERWSK